jgi:hypothetical protein
MLTHVAPPLPAAATTSYECFGSKLPDSSLRMNQIYNSRHADRVRDAIIGCRQFGDY